MACHDPIPIKVDDYGNYVPVMCGKCPACVKRRVDSWVFRCEQEDLNSRSSHFLTLTYSQESLPFTNPDRPKYKGSFPTLKKRHFQLFMKRLRKAVYKDFPEHPKIKYYACGEYGETHRRPHYHAIIFNVPSPVYYTDAWTVVTKEKKKKVQLGMIHVGQTTSNSIAYVASYISKSSGKTPWPECEREFALFSRRIGECYLIAERCRDGSIAQYTPQYFYHRNHPDQLYLTKPGGGRIAMPPYYRKIIWSEDERSDQRFIIGDAIDKQQLKDIKQMSARGKSYHKEKGNDIRAQQRRYNSKLIQKKRHYE